MPKPILSLTLPRRVSQHQIAEFSKHCEEIGVAKEYWILAFHGEVDEPKVEVFYEKDFNQVKYEELKALIEKRFHEDKEANNSTGR